MKQISRVFELKVLMTVCWTKILNISKFCPLCTIFMTIAQNCRRSEIIKFNDDAQSINVLKVGIVLKTLSKFDNNTRIYEGFYQDSQLLQNVWKCEVFLTIINFIKQLNILSCLKKVCLNFRYRSGDFTSIKLSHENI